MRVLIPVDHAQGITGPHRNVVGSLNALTARSDIEVVLVTGKIDEDEPYAQSARIDIRFGYNPHDPARIWSNLRTLRAAARGCDLVYVPTNLKSLLYAQSVRHGRPLVAGPNVTHLPKTPSSRHDSPGKIELLLLSNAWFEPSRMRQNHLRRISGVQRVGYIHHSVDLCQFRPDRRDPTIWARHGIPMEPCKVLFVGRDNEARKGVPQLLEAAELLWSRGRTDLHFVLVGNMSTATRERVATLPNATVLGFQQGEDLAALYASSDIAIVPSSWETFGFTVLEAMASGLPVVASNIGAFREIVTPDESGILVDAVLPRSVFRPDAAELFAAALIRLADDPSLCQQLSMAARARAEAHFSEARLGNDLVGLFHAALRKDRDYFVD